MKQMNLQLNKEFLRNLKRLMQLSGIRTKSEAIRQAVARAVEDRLARKQQTNFRAWIGIGLRSPLKQSRQFKTEDDLWSK